MQRKEVDGYKKIIKKQYQKTAEELSSDREDLETAKNNLKEIEVSNLNNLDDPRKKIVEKYIFRRKELRESLNADLDVLRSNNFNSLNVLLAQLRLHLIQQIDDIIQSIFNKSSLQESQLVAFKNEIKRINKISNLIKEEKQTSKIEMEVEEEARKEEARKEEARKEEARRKEARKEKACKERARREEERKEKLRREEKTKILNDLSKKEVEARKRVKEIEETDLLFLLLRFKEKLNQSYFSDPVHQRSVQKKIVKDKVIELIKFLENPSKKASFDSLSSLESSISTLLELDKTVQSDSSFFSILREASIQEIILNVEIGIIGKKILENEDFRKLKLFAGIEDTLLREKELQKEEQQKQKFIEAKNILTNLLISFNKQLEVKIKIEDLKDLEALKDTFLSIYPAVSKCHIENYDKQNEIEISNLLSMIGNLFTDEKSKNEFLRKCLTIDLKEYQNIRKGELKGKNVSEETTLGDRFLSFFNLDSGYSAGIKFSAIAKLSKFIAQMSKKDNTKFESDWISPEEFKALHSSRVGRIISRYEKLDVISFKKMVENKSIQKQSK